MTLVERAARLQTDIENRFRRPPLRFKKVILRTPSEIASGVLAMCVGLGLGLMGLIMGYYSWVGLGGVLLMIMILLYDW